jgi:hypothetical protein
VSTCQSRESDYPGPGHRPHRWMWVPESLRGGVGFRDDEVGYRAAQPAGQMTRAGATAILSSRKLRTTQKVARPASDPQMATKNEAM